MAKPKLEVIQALRNTAKKLELTNDYQWGHMGLCNCGFLAQEVTHLSKSEIHQRAMERCGDWNDQLNDYCPTSRMCIDDVISELLNFGFDIDDLKHLERLSDKNILIHLPQSKRYLKHNLKSDVSLYLKTMADILERKLLYRINISSLEEEISTERFRTKILT